MGLRSLFVQIETQFLQFAVVFDELLLTALELLQFALIRRHFLTHYRGRVAAESLPLAGQLATLLSIIVQKAAKVS
jgi:hypothetical protein